MSAIQNPATRQRQVELWTPPRAVLRVIVPVMRRLLTSRLHRPLSLRLMVVHVRGRRTGRAYDFPVGRHAVDGHLYAVTHAPWRVNFRGGAACAVTLDGRRRSAHGDLIEDPRAVAEVYATLAAEMGVTLARLRLSIRSRLGRPPTAEELTPLVRPLGLSVIRITLS